MAQIMARAALGLAERDCGALSMARRRADSFDAEVCWIRTQIPPPLVKIAENSDCKQKIALPHRLVNCKVELGSKSLPARLRDRLMNDPRLNSIHLDFPRREDFRRAREMLLSGRGLLTLAGEKQSLSSPEAGSHTMVQEAVDEAPPSADHWLIDKGTVYPLKIGVNTIGRLPDNDVVIQGPYVSRRHCAILVHSGDKCELYDIASKNGTFINGAKLSGPTCLHPGDDIQMCDRHFAFMSRTIPKVPADHDATFSE
jgi:hypothetical protein